MAAASPGSSTCPAASPSSATSPEPTRYTLRTHRYQPYVEALVGGSNELSNYAYVSNVTSLAVQAGIGLNTTLNRYIAFNIFEADYIYSQLPNGVNDNYQNDLRIRTGIVFRFGPR
jgi:hypothetical protein